MKNLSLALFTCILLAACGFEPVYGINRNTPVGVEEHFGRIAIGNIPDREGQYLRNALIDRFYRSGRPTAPSYTLSIDPIVESLTELDITRTSEATRGQLRLTTRMILKDNTGRTSLDRDLHAISSYNVLASEFATRVTEEKARENALDDLARQIETQTGLYFKR